MVEVVRHRYRDGIDRGSARTASALDVQRTDD